jgi:hypothetical protein
VQRLAQVVDRAREGGEVEHEVDRLVDVDPLDHVVVHERESVVPDVLEVRESARLEIVHADDAMPLREQVFAEMGAEEPGSAGNDGSGHWRVRIPPVSADPRDPYERLTGTKPLLARVFAGRLTTFGLFAHWPTVKVCEVPTT